jgi:hypothetical protein
VRSILLDPASLAQAGAADKAIAFRRR